MQAAVPMQRAAGPAPRVPARQPIPAPPVARSAPQRELPPRDLGPVLSGPAPINPARLRLTLPMWTKVCVVLGAVLVLVGFGGLGAAYAVNQQADTRTAGNELIRR